MVSDDTEHTCMVAQALITLTIDGTEGDDQIQVSQTTRGGQTFIQVPTFSGVPGRAIAAGDVNRIVVNGHCGDDRIEIAASIETPTELNGGGDVARCGRGATATLAAAGTLARPVAVSVPI